MFLCVNKLTHFNGAMKVLELFEFTIVSFKYKKINTNCLGEAGQSD